jgi:hypothetical protein
MRQVAGERKGTFDADTFDDTVGTKIKDPTESVFGRSTVSQEQLQRQDLLPETKVETPQEKLKVTSANVQRGLVEPPLKGILENLKGPKLKAEKETINRNPRGGVDAIAKQALDRQAMIESANPDDRIANQLGSLGISPDPSKLSTQAQQEAAALGISTDPSRFAGSTKGTLADPLEKQDFIDTPTKQTFVQSVGTALKDFVSPAMAVMQELGKPVNESAGVVAFNKTYFTDRGDGRIGGNPAEDLYAGMNRVSKFGNLEKAGDKRLEKRNNTISKRGVNDKAYADANGLKYDPKGVSVKFHKNTVNMEGQQKTYKENKKKEAPTTGTTKPGETGGTTDKQGCVIATHAVNSGAFTADTKREAVRWCVKNLHRTWWGEAIRRGYRYYGQKAINEGNAKNHYQEFKDYVAFGTGKKRTLKTAWTFIYRTIQFFIKGVTIKK